MSECSLVSWISSCSHSSTTFTVSILLTVTVVVDAASLGEFDGVVVDGLGGCDCGVVVGGVLDVHGVARGVRVVGVLQVGQDRRRDPGDAGRGRAVQQRTGVASLQRHFLHSLAHMVVRVIAALRLRHVGFEVFLSNIYIFAT